MAIQAHLCSDNLGFPLGTSQDLMMENSACGLYQFSSFTHPQQSESEQMHSLQLQLRKQVGDNNACIDNGSLLPNNNTIYGDEFQNLSAQMEKESLEIDRLLNLQNERLKWVLQEQRKQQVSLILNKFERKIQFLLGQKDGEIAKATNRRVELEYFLKRIDYENQTWQRLAKENEAMVLCLNNTIEQIRLSTCLATINGTSAEDAESCCGDVFRNRARNSLASAAAEEEENSINIAKLENAEQTTRKVLCKGCNSRCSSIIILPCRHLCLCQACEAIVYSCPVCGTEKKATIEALI